MFNLLKKFIFMLNIESVKNKNIENIMVLADIGSKATVTNEVENALKTLLQFKEIAAELEAENAALKEKAEKQPPVYSDEQEIYKNIMLKLGDTVYSANKSAEDIIAKAKETSDNIIGKANDEASEIVGGANSKKVGIIEESKKIMADFKEKYDFIKQEHAGMVQTYKEISGKYTLRLSELEDTINIIYDALIGENLDED